MNSQKLVIDVMESQIDTWQGIRELKNCYDGFVKNFKDISDCHNELDKSTDGLYSAGKTSRMDLIKQVFPVLSVLNIYATDHGSKKMLSQSK